MFKVVHEENEANSHTPAAVGGSLLDEIVRDGARQMPAAALQAEVAAYIKSLRQAARRERALAGGPQRLSRRAAHVPYAGADDGRGRPHVPLEQVGGPVRGPAAAFGEPAWDGEVVEGDHGTEAAFDGAVDHAPVVGDLGLGEVAGAGSMRAHAMLKR